MKREDTVDYNIKSAWHSISRMYNQYGQQFDVTASTGFVLLNIDAEAGTPATKIAPMMGMESRSLTRMLKTMEEKKWIRREKDPEDGRSVRIILTELGKQKRDISRFSVKEFNKKIAQKVSESDMNTFFNVIKQINEISENREVITEAIEKMDALLNEESTIKSNNITL
ncbi:MAG: MarR family transcriptional regulator [Cyclobacteriaceae bacterium]